MTVLDEFINSEMCRKVWLPFSLMPSYRSSLEFQTETYHIQVKNSVFSSKRDFDHGRSPMGSHEIDEKTCRLFGCCKIKYFSDLQQLQRFHWTSGWEPIGTALRIRRTRIIYCNPRPPSSCSNFFFYMSSLACNYHNWGFWIHTNKIHLIIWEFAINSVEVTYFITLIKAQRIACRFNVSYSLL